MGAADAIDPATLPWADSAPPDDCLLPGNDTAPDNDTVPDNGPLPASGPPETNSTAQPPAVAAAATLLAALSRHGVRQVVLCPGSRSAPLAYAAVRLAARGEVSLHVRIDERSAGFLALGLAKATGEPAAVITTSGTAVANLHPAVLEAHHGRVPLLLLTADRPAELRGTGANQTTEQVGIFAGATRLMVDVPAPTAPDPSTAPGAPTAQGDYSALPALAARAYAAAAGRESGHPGPVHLNLCYREPLVPAWTLVPTSTLVPAWPLPVPACSDGLPLPSATASDAPEPLAVRGGSASGGHGPGDQIALGPHPERTVVLAGDGAGAGARALAEAQGWPLFAEPSSGALGGPNAVAGYRELLTVPSLVDEINQVVVFGRPTLSRPPQRLLARPDVLVTVVSPGPGPHYDPTRSAQAVLPGLSPSWLLPRPAVPSEFLARWERRSQAASAAIAAATGGPALDQLSAVRTLVEAGAAEDVIVTGPSGPVRDLELVALADGPQVVANRGLAGIDGVVSTAVGFALAHPGRVRALLGDLTFLHDIGGLLIGPGEARPDLQLLVINDGGGSIFDTLEPGQLADASAGAAAEFRRVFTTPHGASLAALCAGYGVEHILTTERAELAALLAAPPRGMQVVEVVVPGGTRRARAHSLRQAICAAAATAH